MSRKNILSLPGDTYLGCICFAGNIAQLCLIFCSALRLWKVCIHMICNILSKRNCQTLLPREIVRKLLYLHGLFFLVRIILMAWSSILSSRIVLFRKYNFEGYSSFLAPALLIFVSELVLNLINGVEL